MSIVVPADLEENIRQKVESRQYDDPSAVIRAAPRLLEGAIAGVRSFARRSRKAWQSSTAAKGKS